MKLIESSYADRLSAVSPRLRDLFEDHNDHLAKLRTASRLRQLRTREGIDFASNDYLGLGGSELLGGEVRAALERAVPLGAGGSRLLRGNHEEHERLETEAASFFGSESALYFSSGYAANSALLSTLPQRGDLVLHDELIHASAHEGLRLSRAQRLAFMHNDVSHLERLALQWRQSGSKARLWVVVESLYSMDGDLAPLLELESLAERFEAVLIVDEAHATGIYGESGRGLSADLDGPGDVITLRTCGKALGCEGALVCGPRIVKDFLINRGRAFIFSTAPSPLMAAAVRASLRVVADANELRERLLDNVELAQSLACALGLPASGSQIIPIVLGDDARVMELAASLQAAGFDVRGIRPPTVPAGTSRLRLSITLNVTRSEIEALFGALAVLL